MKTKIILRLFIVCLVILPACRPTRSIWLVNTSNNLAVISEYRGDTLKIDTLGFQEKYYFGMILGRYSHTKRDLVPFEKLADSLEINYGGKIIKYDSLDIKNYILQEAIKGDSIRKKIFRSRQKTFNIIWEINDPILNSEPEFIR